MPSMDDLRRLEAKGLARAKIRSKRRRVSAIRSRTIRGSLALFAIAWAIVFGQLVTGNDPALSRTYGTRTHKLFASTHRGNSSSHPPRQSEEESVAPVVVPVEPEVSEEPEVPVESEVEPEPESEVEVEPEPAPEPVITAAS
jgi:hypothetical protein